MKIEKEIIIRTIWGVIPIGILITIFTCFIFYFIQTEEELNTENYSLFLLFIGGFFILFLLICLFKY